MKLVVGTLLFLLILTVRKGQFISNLSAQSVPIDTEWGLDASSLDVYPETGLDWLNHKYQLPEYQTTLNHLGDLGVKWIRIGFWQDRGYSDIEGYKKYVEDLNSIGINISAVLWSSWCGTDNLTGFYEFVSAIASEFSGKIDAYEIFNEMDDPICNDCVGETDDCVDPGWTSNWPGVLELDEHPEIYAEILNTSYEIIKKADPNAIVTHGGLAISDFDFVNWLSLVEANGGKFDVVNLHLYEWWSQSNPIYIENFTDRINSLKRFGKPVWVTETFYVGGQCDETFSEDYQISWLERLFLEVNGTADKVFLFYYPCFLNESGSLNRGYYTYKDFLSLDCNECVSGEDRCYDFDSYQKCIIVNSCYKWSEPNDCYGSETCNGGSCQAHADGLLSHWKFDEGSGNTAYDSVGTHNGKINGALWTTGISGNALQFDGINDFVDTNLPESDSDHSFFMWIKRGDTENEIKMMIGESDTQYFGIFSGGGQRLILRMKNNIGQFESCFGSVDIIDSNWHFVGFTIENRGGEVIRRIYLDGIDDTDSGLCSVWPGQIGIQNIGKFIGQAYSKFYFNGTIDEVRIYNKALSAEEVWRLYEGEKLKGDVDGDGDVDGSDARIVLQNYLSASPNPAQVDINKDGNVNVLDFGWVVYYWGKAQ